MTIPRRLLPASHPVRGAVADWLACGYVDPGIPLVVAVSGGADSLALAAAVIDCVSADSASALIVDHQLQEGSATAAATAAEQLRGLGYRAVDIRRVTVTGEGGTEAAARRARYHVLAAGASHLGGAALLGHTLDDQAETVLLGLSRGSGPRSIAGMRPWRAPWGRPLLGVRRAETQDACADLGIAPWHDPQNIDPSFTRVRLRHEVLPLMADVLGRGVGPALARTAALMTDDLDALDELAAQALVAARAGDGLDCRMLADHPVAIRSRVLRTWVMARVGPVDSGHLTRLDRLVTDGTTGQAVRLPGGVDAVRRRGELHFIDPAAA